MENEVHHKASIGTLLEVFLRDNLMMMTDYLNRNDRLYGSWKHQ